MKDETDIKNEHRPLKTMNKHPEASANEPFIHQIVARHTLTNTVMTKDFRLWCCCAIFKWVVNRKGDLGNADGIYLRPVAKIPTPPPTVVNMFVGFIEKMA